MNYCLWYVVLSISKLLYLQLMGKKWEACIVHLVVALTLSSPLKPNKTMTQSICRLKQQLNCSRVIEL